METNSKAANPIIDLVTIVLTLVSIVLSQILFYSGKKELGIFIGLWPPTFVALGTLFKQTYGKPGESPDLPMKNMGNS
ncbi:MAG: hypothetical protein JWP00_4506 [Chloroflexi bacterium]|jgi:hypothetical protein|nr:hypothetical protein [Chloroflexota bacterium]